MFKLKEKTHAAKRNYNIFSLYKVVCAMSFGNLSASDFLT
jgi:hypothetical protein